MSNKNIIERRQFYVKARLFPTLCGSLPILWIIFLIAYSNQEELLHVLKFLPKLSPVLKIIITGVPVISALVFFLVHVNRLISKELFSKTFFSRRKAHAYN